MADEARGPGPAGAPPPDSPEHPEKETPSPRLREGVDFYFENGLMVLTAHFLRRRGYCCGSGCRHCPYDKKTGKPL